MNKTEELISKAKAIKKQMVALARTEPAVQQYLRLQGKRENVHQQLTKHVETYGVDTEKYKKFGMVAQHRSSVKATDVHDLAQEVGGEIGKRIFKLINKSLVVFTK